MHTDSEEGTGDERKRKKESPSPFKRSKKMHRSPLKGEKEEGENEELKKLLREMFTEIKAIRKENQEHREEISKLREVNELNKKELEELRGRVEHLENKIEFNEREKKRNNIIIRGLEMDTGSQERVKAGIAAFLQEKLGVKINIVKVQKINDYMAVVEVNGWEEKQEIMMRKGKLKEITDMKVYIDHDLTKKEQEIQQKIREISRQERKEGKEVRVGFNKLWINGEKWMWNRGKQILEKWKGNGQLGVALDKNVSQKN